MKKSISRDERGVESIPLKLIIVALIIAIIIPAAWNGIASYSGTMVENDVRSNIDEIIHASKQAHEGGNGTKFEFTVNFEDGSFNKIEKIEVGDELEGTHASIVTYKLSNRGTNFMVIENPNVPITSIKNGPVTDIKINSEEKLIAEHIQIGPQSFIVIRRPDEKIQWNCFDLDLGIAQPDLAIESEDILFTIIKKYGNEPDLVKINILVHNIGNKDSEPFDIEIRVEDQITNKERIGGIKTGNLDKITLEQSLDSGVVVSVNLDIKNEISEKRRDNNKAQNIYEDLPLVYISGSSSIGGTRGDIDLIAQGLDTIVVEYLLKDEVKKLYLQGYNEADTEDDADIVVLVGGPDANVDWSIDLNTYTKTDSKYGWYWDFDKGELRVDDYKGIRASSGVVGAGVIEDTNTEYDGKSFVWIYGVWFIGTIAAARAFINYGAEEFLPHANDQDPHARFVENAFLDEEQDSGNLEYVHDWDFYQNNPEKMEELRQETYFYLGYNLIDTDNDGMSNGVEEEITKTDPLIWDSDRDDMDDAWEMQYYPTLDPLNKDDRNKDSESDYTDGIKNIDEYNFGGNPIEPDIFIEVDCMVDTDHSHILSTQTITLIDNGFSNVPASHINIHIVISEQLTHIPILPININNPSSDIPNEYDITELRNDHFSQNRQGVFYYAIIGHRYTEIPNRGWSSGIANDIPGEFFFVADDVVENLFSEGTHEQRLASTFIHELGHCLGLKHNGNSHSPTDSPDYVSIMSYAYQLHIDDWPDGNSNWQNWAGLTLNWDGIPQYGNKFNNDHTKVIFIDWEDLDFTGR